MKSVGSIDSILWAVCLLLAMPAQAASGLGAALQAALSQHPSVSAKRAEVAAKAHLVDSAKAQRYPSLSGQLAAQNNDSQPANVRLRQPLWAFGRIDSNIDYADAGRSLEEANLLRLRRQMMDETSVAYARVLGVTQRLRIAAENLAGLDRMYRQIQRREQGQLAAQADVRLALARLTQARALQERLVGELEIARTDLLNLTQTPVAAGEPPPEWVTRLPRLAEIEVLAETQSADIRVKTQELALAQADAARERSAPMPTLYLQADKPFNQPLGFSNEGRIGIVLEGAIDGMGLAASGRNQAAEARKQAAMDTLAAARSEVKRSVSSLWSQRQVQTALLESRKHSVAELTEILASYQRQYEAGQKSWLDVLNMQRELADERQQHAQSEQDWMTVTLKLAALTGALDRLAEPR